MKFCHIATLFTDLSREVKKVARHYAQFDPEEEALNGFWTGYQNRTQPQLLEDKVKQFSEL